MSASSWIVALSTTFIPCVAMAQESQAARGLAQAQAQNPIDPKLNQIRVYRLKYSYSDDTAAIINNLLHNNWVQGDARTNSLLYVGPASYIEHVEKIIEKLDAPTEDRSNGNFVLVSIAHRDANELASKLMATFGKQNISVAGDRNRSKIILHGSESSISQAKELISSLDTLAGSASLEFIFLKARLQPMQTAPVIPDDLKEVEKELQRFGQIQLLGRLSTVAVEDESFQVAGSVSEFIQAQIKGRLLRANSEGAQFQVEADMHMDPAKPADNSGNPNLPQKPVGPPPRFEVSTVVSVKYGEYVVMGAAPNGWSPGESAILVLHVVAK